ncbi:MAG TPA: hypothetical protein VJ547_03500 [Candidatus Thermoplasmatota archaeon]|nr:hypothetical protein [Candidatus Thermoplasmatota archaeon]
MKPAGSAAAPAEGLSQWSYALLPDGTEVQDTIAEWLGQASEKAYRGVWVSRSRPYKKKVAAQLGLIVALVPAGILFLSTFRALGLQGALGLCATTYAVFAVPVWVSLRTLWARDLRGTCDLYAPEGLGGDAFKAVLHKGFENAGMPVERVLRAERTFEEWQFPGTLAFTFWKADATTPDRAQLAWRRRADPMSFRILKGMVLAAVRSAPAGPKPEAGPPDRNVLAKAREV